MKRSWKMQIKNKKKQRWYKAAGKAKTLIFLHCADLLLKKAKYKRMKLLKCKNTKIKNTNIKNTHAIWHCQSVQPQLVTFLAQHSQSDVLVQKSDKTKVQRPPVLCKICRKINLSEIDQQRAAADTSQSCVGGRKGKIFIHCLKCPFNFVTGSTITTGYLRSQIYLTCFSLLFASV